MKLKDCRILWNQEIGFNEALISDIEIHEFSKENGSYDQNKFYHKKFDFDYGNCHFDMWHEMNLSKIIIEFLIIRKYSSEEIRNKFIKELHKLDEFKEEFNWLKN